MAQKANITLSVPKDLYDRMKRHPEVKWSQAARQGIIRKLAELEGFVKSPDFFDSLPAEAKKGIEEESKLTKKDWEKYYHKMKESEWRRTKSLIRAY